MSEQIVSEASAWQGTIECDYRESAQIFGLAPSKVFIRRRLNLHPSSFWQGCPKTDQYLTKNLPHHLTRDPSKIAPRLLERFFEHYFRYTMNADNCFEQVDGLIAIKNQSNNTSKQCAQSSHWGRSYSTSRLRTSPMTTHLSLSPMSGGEETPQVEDGQRATSRANKLA